MTWAVTKYVHIDPINGPPRHDLRKLKLPDDPDIKWQQKYEDMQGMEARHLLSMEPHS